MLGRRLCIEVADLARMSEFVWDLQKREEYHRKKKGPQPVVQVDEFGW